MAGDHQHGNSGRGGSIGGTIVVTGASSGIGQACARLLAPVARVMVLVARRTERLDALAAEIKVAHPQLAVHVRGCDLADTDATLVLCNWLEHTFGGVDVLVNSAGFGDQNFVEQARWGRLAEMIALNVTALTLLCQRFVPGMVARGRGGILNISSGFGFSYLPGHATYVATKHYVTGFTDTLRAELAGTGVTVTQVCPGPVATEFHEMAKGQVVQRLPGFVVITAERCAEQAVAGFMAGRAMVVPGAVFWWVALASRVTPRWLWRVISARLARRIRARQQEPPR